MVGDQAAALLDALHEPAMLVGRTGTVWRANRACARLFGTDISQTELSGVIATRPDEFALYLARCAGSGEALIGTLDLAVRGTARKTQCRGSAVRGEQSLILLRLMVSSENAFTALTRTVAELKDELGKRKRSEAMLEESVRERELLLRELEHRVKNNMQMLSALLNGAEREATSIEAKEALNNASSRFTAVSAVQQLLYRSENLETIESRALVAALADGASALVARSLDVDVAVDPIELPIDAAVPIGLILNELLTNALKYGLPAEGTQTVRIEFVQENGGLRLCVEDNGPGFDLSETSKRASGIGLVRGLLRQLGGSIEVEKRIGARAIATFPQPKGVPLRDAQ